MATVTKKELISRIAERTQAKRILVKHIVQAFLDEIVDELQKNNRLEFRDSKPEPEAPESPRIQGLSSASMSLQKGL
jgi:hypothetical protein